MISPISCNILGLYGCVALSILKVFRFVSCDSVTGRM